MMIIQDGLIFSHQFMNSPQPTIDIKMIQVFHCDLIFWTTHAKVTQVKSKEGIKLFHNNTQWQPYEASLTSTSGYNLPPELASKGRNSTHWKAELAIKIHQHSQFLFTPQENKLKKRLWIQVA